DVDSTDEPIDIDLVEQRVQVDPVEDGLHVDLAEHRVERDRPKQPVDWPVVALVVHRAIVHPHRRERHSIHEPPERPRSGAVSSDEHADTEAQRAGTAMAK
ncbi:MAG TPA: hypothetical protein VIX84_18515, partial [Acidimicrobiales bacterium]